MNTITFETVSESELDEFKKRLQTAFSLALIKQDGKAPDKPVPADRDIERNYYSQEAETYNIYASGQRIGGVILTTNRISNHNHLDFSLLTQNIIARGSVMQCGKQSRQNTPKQKSGKPVPRILKRETSTFM